VAPFQAHSATALLTRRWRDPICGHAKGTLKPPLSPGRRTAASHPGPCSQSRSVGQISSGRSIDSLLADYPYSEREDILQPVRYAAWLPEGREFELTTA